ncbi:MAG: hypothetical protein Q7T74_05080 [Candidatus Saccharibacteria bacterium]|nr:hypothetical protein [Candidatus Saccharibacteria bacterium]
MDNSKPLLDYTALSRPVSRAEKLHHKDFRAVIVVGILFIISFITTVIGIFLHGNFTLVAACAFGSALFLLGGIALYQSIDNTIRLALFVQQNNLIYKEDVPYDNRAGIIFHEGRDKTFITLISATKQIFSEIGVYEFTTGSGKNETTHTFSFVKIKLPRRLPNMVLDSKANNTFGKISNLPTGLSSNQRLSLEGNFDSYFTLYTPAEYKTDALYIFTPDVMQALVDSAKDYDCEVIDDNFYIYIPETLDITDAKALQDVLSIASKLHTELVAQADYYADDRVGDRALNTVGTTGVRLKNRMSAVKIIGIIITTIVVIFNLAPLVISLLLAFVSMFFKS